MSVDNNKKRKEAAEDFDDSDGTAAVAALNLRIHDLENAVAAIARLIERLEKLRGQAMTAIMGEDCKMKEPACFKVEDIKFDHSYWSATNKDGWRVGKTGTWLEISYQPDDNPALVCRRRYGSADFPGGRCAEQTVHTPGDKSSSGNTYDSRHCYFADAFADRAFSKIDILKKLKLFDEKIAQARKAIDE